MRRRYGLDLPWYEQYGTYLAGVATLNLGPSLSYRNRTVEQIIVEQGPITLELALLALTFALVLGIPIGLVVDFTHTPAVALERVLTSLALAWLFFVGTMLIYLVAVRAQLVPTTGWDSWQSKVLPVVTLGLVPLAYCIRLTRAAVLETLRSDYVRTATAKGLRRRGWSHSTSSASLVPVLSAAGPLLGAMVTTIFVVEVVFAIPGLARHYVSATTASDYPLLMGMTVVLTLFIVVANLVVDLALAALDPRQRVGSRPMRRVALAAFAALVLPRPPPLPPVSRTVSPPPRSPRRRASLDALERARPGAPLRLALPRRGLPVAGSTCGRHEGATSSCSGVHGLEPNRRHVYSFTTRVGRIRVGTTGEFRRAPPVRPAGDPLRGQRRRRRLDRPEVGQARLQPLPGVRADGG